MTGQTETAAAWTKAQMDLLEGAVKRIAAADAVADDMDKRRAVRLSAAEVTMLNLYHGADMQQAIYLAALYQRLLRAEKKGVGMTLRRGGGFNDDAVMLHAEHVRMRRNVLEQVE